MKRYATAIGCAGLLGLSSACSNARQADIQAVKKVEMAWVKDCALKDPAKFASYYAIDAVALFPNSRVINGKANIQEALTTVMTDPNFSLSFQSTHAEASKGGDLVYTVGVCSLTTSDPKTHKPVTEKGKYMTVYKKQADGTWKAEAEMVNSNMPAAS
jgi:uncharacterized protein (TIGR02246 family)